MPSLYRLQIIEAATGEVVQRWLPGLAAEVELIDNLATRVVAKGVGVGRTAAHVKADVIDAMQELLHDLKRTVPPQ